MKNKSRIHPINIVFMVLTILWMWVIFNLSSESGGNSSSRSEKLVVFFVKMFNTGFRNDTLSLDEKAKVLEFIQNVMFFVRKMAHFTAYAILAFLVHYSICFVNIKKLVILTLLICLAYAVSDEIHQLFVPGRSGKATDVLIDFSGSVVGFVFTYYLNKLIQTKILKKPT